MSDSQPQKMEQNHNALLIIDVQKGLFRKSTSIYKADELLENINLLIDSAHETKVPVFFIQHADGRALVKGSEDWQLHSELHCSRADNLIHKQHGNAFEETNLDQLLKSKTITNLVIAGLVTHGCVRATCLGALNLGYTVSLVSDGHSSYSNQAKILIEEWNQKLSEKNIKVIAASDIEFNC
jgi:nicotinamidase-related amidase